MLFQSAQEKSESRNVLQKGLNITENVLLLGRNRVKRVDGEGEYVHIKRFDEKKKGNLNTYNFHLLRENVRAATKWILWWDRFANCCSTFDDVNTVDT